LPGIPEPASLAGPGPGASSARSGLVAPLVSMAVDEEDVGLVASLFAWPLGIGLYFGVRAVWGWYVDRRA
jgi:hypothetical protein